MRTVHDPPPANVLAMRILKILRSSPLVAKEALFEQLLDTLDGVNAVSKRAQKRLRPRFHAALSYLVRGGAITPVPEPPNVSYVVTPLGRDMPDAEMTARIDRLKEKDDLKWAVPFNPSS